MRLTTDDVWSVVIFSLVFFIILIYRWSVKPSGLPRGPPTLPFIGNLDLTWDKRFYLVAAKLRKKYGNMYSLQLGWYPAVVLADADLLKEAFVDKADKFSNRTSEFAFHRIFRLNKGVVSTHGDLWKYSRKMSMSTLRDFGVGKSSIEPTIHLEAECVLAEVEKHDGKPFETGLLFSKASCNVICYILFAERLDYDDPNLLSVLTFLKLFFDRAKLFPTPTALPFLLPFIFFFKETYTNIGAMKQFLAFLDKKVKDHEQTFDPNHIRDIVDAFLEGKKKNPELKACSDDNLLVVMRDLYFAGTETTNTTMNWMFLFMVKHPQVQKKCRQLILQEIGSERLPSMTDRDKLPYIEATISECQRLSNIVPHSIFHCTNGPVEFQGYTLPDKTIIIPDLYSVHMNPDDWENPEEFRPERFLDENGKYKKPASFMPFSIGRRICLGEQLAKAELFIFFTSLLQRFELSSEDVGSLPSPEEALHNVTLSLPPFKVKAKSVA